MTAQYPPMGWNSWDCYGAAVTEETVRRNADYMASKLLKYGWEYIVVDILWSRPNAVDHSYEPFCDLCMDEYGRLIPAENRFPSAKGGAGFKPLAQAEHLKQYANMWRITDDFWDDWALLKGMFERAEKWCVHAGPGHWPDADMLPLGALRQCEDPEAVTAFTPAEQRTMMTLWCMMRSPLMMGGEMTKNDDFTLSLLTRGPVLAIEKESFCAHPVRTTEEESVWIAPRKDGTGLYAALFNLSGESRAVDAGEILNDRPWAEAWELWSGDRFSLREKGLSAVIPAHDARVYLLK